MEGESAPMHLPGAMQGASYLGQLRRAAAIAYGHQADVYLAVSVGGQGGHPVGLRDRYVCGVRVREV